MEGIMKCVVKTAAGVGNVELVQRPIPQVGPNDILIKVHVNKTSSAVRMTHIPTGIVVECQDERSQMENRAKATRVLKARLFDKAQQEAKAEETEARRSQVGTGDRSERIRTYNYPQGRVTDHRINLTLYKLENVLNGDLDDFIQALAEARRAELMKEEGNE